VGGWTRALPPDLPLITDVTMSQDHYGRTTTHTVKMEIFFTGISVDQSGVRAVFERLSIAFTPRLDVQQGND
jgi:hypothetical protein